MRLFLVNLFMSFLCAIACEFCEFVLCCFECLLSVCFVSSLCELLCEFLVGDYFVNFVFL